MAKKKTDGFNFGKTLNAVLEKSLQTLVATVAQHSSHIIDWVKNIPNFKRKFKHVLTAVTLSLAGIIVLAFGVAEFLAQIFPELKRGIAHIIVGTVLLIVALLYIKLD